MGLQHPSVYTARRIRELRAQQQHATVGKRFVIGASGSVSSAGYVSSRGLSVQRGTRGIVREALHSATGEARLV